MNILKKFILYIKLKKEIKEINNLLLFLNEINQPEYINLQERLNIPKIQTHVIKDKKKKNIFIGSEKDIYKRLLIRRIIKFEALSRLLKKENDYSYFFNIFKKHLKIEYDVKYISYRTFKECLKKDIDFNNKLNEVKFKEKIYTNQKENYTNQSNIISKDKKILTEDKQDFQQEALNIVLMTAVG